MRFIASPQKSIGGDGDGEAVGGDLDVGGKCWGGVGVSSHVVTEVGEEGAAWFELVDDVEGLAKVEMGDVFFVSQGVEYQRVESAKAFHGLGGHSLAVGDIRKRMAG